MSFVTSFVAKSKTSQKVVVKLVANDIDILPQNSLEYICYYICKYIREIATDIYASIATVVVVDNLNFTASIAAYITASIYMGVAGSFSKYCF
jgi:hypothetical protein